AAAVARTPAANDARAQLPGMIDTQKESARQQALVDAQLKRTEAGLQDQETMQRAGLANRMAIIDQEQAFGFKSDQEAGLARQAALLQMYAFTESSIKKELEAYRHFIEQKKTLFTDDEKGQAELAK